MSVQILTGDCRDVLATLPERSVQCCVTSPPYFGLRAYLPEGDADKAKELGTEQTPDAYVAEMVAVFREVRRVLRDDGTCWLNVGDSYNGGGQSGNNPSQKSTLTTNGGNGTRNRRSVWDIATQPYSGAHFATMPPELAATSIKAGTSERGQCPHCGAPWVRQVERPEPSVSVTGIKSRQYVEQGLVSDGKRRSSFHGAGWRKDEPDVRKTTGWAPSCACPEHRPVPQVVLDPFGGAGTTGLAADRLQRSAVLIELNPTYAALARERINMDGGMFSGAAE